MILKQKNYSNMYLSVLGEQIGSIQNRVEQLIDVMKSKSVITEKPIEITMSKTIGMATPSLQPPPIVTGFELKPIKELEYFLDEKFKKIKLTTLDKNLRDKLIKEPDYKQVYQDQINKLHKWADKPGTGKYYYPRPTPVDVLIEESNEITDELFFFASK